MARRGMAALLATAALGMWGAEARAGDKLRTGAVPAWVVPVAPPPAKAREGALDVRLVDLQLRFDERGLHRHVHQVVKVLAPEGLQAAGNAVVQWQPALGDVTVHRVAVIRDGKPVELLGDGGRFSVIRRESGLESMAQLDGVLTALMPVPDLRVGDELEIAWTVDEANPVLGGHAESDQLFADRGITTDRLHLRYSWPDGRAVRWRGGAGLPRPVEGRAGRDRTLTVDRTDFLPPPLPDGAPARFLDANRLQVADFADWSAVAALMTPLFAQAATPKPGGGIAAEIARIAAASPDPRARAAAALALVQGQVRYFADVAGLGGYRPEQADAVWDARRGDCKGKTVLLLALLRGLGIAADPVLVSARQGDGVDQSLPMPGRFDHVIVRADINGRAYWLDGTRTGDRALDAIAVPGFRWALPLKPGAAAPVALAATEPARPQEAWDVELDARAGLNVPAKFKGVLTYRGDMAAGARGAIAFLDGVKRDEQLRKLWTDRYKDLALTTAGWTADDATGEVRVTVAGTWPMDWDDDGTTRYESSYSRLGTNLAPKREADAPVAPVQVDARHQSWREVVLLPAGGRGFFLEGGALDETDGGVRYLRTAALKGDRFEKLALVRSAPAEVTLAAAQAADKATDALWDKRLFLRAPHDYAPTAAEQVAGGPMEGLALVAAMAQRGEWVPALERTDALLAGTKTAPALAMRAMLLLNMDRGEEADIALDGALAIDSGNESALSMKASRLELLGRTDDALILADRLVLLAPAKTEAYLLRAGLRMEAGKVDGSLADYRIVIDKQPDNAPARIARVRALNRRGDRAAALAEAAAFAAAVPGNAYAHALHGNLLALSDKPVEAKAAIARSLALEPTPDAYFTRARFALSDGPGGQAADVVAAIRLAPTEAIPARLLTRFRPDTGAQVSMLAALDAARPETPAHADRIAALRASYQAAWGEPGAMLARIDKEVAARPRDATLRNDSCWFRATHGVELDRAVVDCDAAVAAARTPAHLDSRGLAHLRRGDFARAVADYDAALVAAPTQAGSLWGRGVARLRAGDRPGGEADLAAARKLSTEVADEFAGYGVTP